MKRILSLGAGVQSSTVALMAASGEIDPIDCAIFADTQWEPKAVYKWLDWLESKLPFPVHRVSAGNIRDGIRNAQNTSGGRFAAVPWFTLHNDGSSGMGRRQCTNEYKLKPLLKKKRELVGLQPRSRAKRGEILCETIIGISIDEAHRMRASDEPWNINKYPLIDKRMTRDDCMAWMDRNYGRIPPKSSCLGCPFHSDSQWAEIKSDQEAWEDVLEIDSLIRDQKNGGLIRQYMHSDRRPIGELIFEADQVNDLFGNECTGLCGV